MIKKTRLLGIIVLILAFVSSLIFASCSVSSGKKDGELKEPKVGDVLTLTDFESIDDMYKIKQTNTSYNSVAVFDISTEERKTGNSSLKYSYFSGPNPELLQRYDQSNLTDYFTVPTATEDKPNPTALLDASKVKSTSVSIYNANEQTTTATLRVVLQGNIPLLDSEAKTLEPNAWTDVSFDLDVLALANNKDSIVGVALIIGANGNEGVYYIDNWTITVGAEATPEQQAEPVIALIDNLPLADQVEGLASVMKVLSAKGAFDLLSEEAQKAVTNSAKLEACLPKVANYGLLFDASSESFSMVTNSGAGWEWVGNMRNVPNDTYGSVLELNVVRLGTGNISELNHQAFANIESYDQIKFFVYNPMEEDRILRYATGQGWSGTVTEFNLTGKQWTECTISANNVGIHGGYFLIQNSLSQGWLFSSIVGLKASSRANAVETLIDALPSVENATESDVAAIQNALDSYNALTEVAQKLVDKEKYNKLVELASAFIYGDYALPVKESITTLDSQLNGVVDSFDDIGAINVVKNEYDSIIDEAKPFVTNIDVLNSYLEKATAYHGSIDAVKAIIATFDSKINTFEEIYRVLSAKSIFESLNGETQALLTNEEKDIYDSAIESINGYTLLSDAFDGELLTTPAPGDFHNNSEVRHSYDQRLGNVYTLKVFSTANANNAASFKPFGSLKTTNISAVVLYIKNGTGAWQNMFAAYLTDWSNSYAKQCAGSAQPGADVWTQLIIPVEGFYSVDDVFYVLNSASDGAVTNGIWMISSFMGLSSFAYNKILAQDTIDMIDALPEAGEVTLNHVSVINMARSSYDNLSNEAKETVGNYSKLTDCETALANAINTATNSINDKISALPNANDITAENVLTYRDAILLAKSSFDTAIEQVKSGVTDVAKLNANVDKLNEFMSLVINNMINDLSVVTDIDTDEERLYALYVINTYNSLDDATKEQITVENVQKINACIEKLAGYSLIADATNKDSLLSGRDTGNAGTVSSVANSQFGYVYSLSFANEAANSDIHIADVQFNYTGFGAVVFSVYNPYDVNVNLILYDASWGGWNFIASASARNWTKVLVDVDGTSYGEKGFFIIICTGDMLNTNASATAEGKWLVTSFMGIDKNTFDNLAVPGVIELITALPQANEVTIANNDAINAAKEAFDSLSESAKANVTNKEKLEECVTALANAYTAEATRVSELIEALPTANEIVDLTSKDAINNAKSAYELLPNEVKTQISSELVTKLGACVEALEVVQKSVNDQAAADLISQQIASLLAVDDITEANAFAQRQAIIEARASLTNATADVLAKVPQADKDKVTALEEKLATLSKQIVNGIVESMANANEINTIEEINKILYQIADFDALGEEDKALITNDNATKLASVRAAIEGYTIVVNPISNTCTIAGATFETKIDETYGYVYEASFADAQVGWLTANFDAPAYDNYFAYWFAVYNPIGWNSSIVVLDANGAWAPSYSVVQMPAGWNVYCVSATELTGGSDNISLMFNVSGGNWNGLKITGITAMSENAYNKFLASKVVALINALPTTITYANEKQVTDAKTAFDNLPTEIQSFVTNKEVLDLAITALNASINAQAKAAQDLIDALPEASAVEVSHKAQIEATRTAYDELRTTCKTAYDKVVIIKLIEVEEALAKLDQRTEAQKLIEFIGTLPSEVTTNAQRIQILQLKATVDTKYASLDETNKATVDANETYQALVGLATAIVNDGYEIAVDGTVDMISNVGGDAGNNGAKENANDVTYGNIVKVTFNVENLTGSIRITKALDVKYDKVIFGIYNPLDTDVTNVVYDASWSKSQNVICASKSWTFVTVEDVAMLKNFFIVINSTSASTGEWLVTGILGHVAPTVDPGEGGNEQTTVIADASTTAQFYVYDQKSVDKPNATMTVSTDADKGNVFVIAYNESAVCTSIGLQTLNLTLTDYNKLRFEVYNSGTEDITVGVQEMANWNFIGTQTVKAGEWTTVEIDLTNTSANVLIYINGVAGNTYKMSKLVGVKA